MRILTSVAIVCLFLCGSAVTAREKVQSGAAPVSVSALKAETSVVCSSIVDREPAGVQSKFPKGSKEIFFFTLITGAADSTKIEHRWYYKGDRVQTSVLNVKSSSWRTFSKRSLINSVEAAGEWKAEAVEQETGRVLSSVAFTIE